MFMKVIKTNPTDLLCKRFDDSVVAVSTEIGRAMLGALVHPYTHVQSSTSISTALNILFVV